MIGGKDLSKRQPMHSQQRRKHQLGGHSETQKQAACQEKIESFDEQQKGLIKGLANLIEKTRREHIGKSQITRKKKIRKWFTSVFRYNIGRDLLATVNPVLGKIDAEANILCSILTKRACIDRLKVLHQQPNDQQTHCRC